MQNKLELDYSECNEELQKQDASTVKDWMGRKMHFRCFEHYQAFERLTKRQQQYIASYMHKPSRQSIAKELGIESSPKTIGKTLGAIAKKMQVKLRELRAEETETSAKQLKQMIVAQDYRCALSGEQLEPQTATLDHKIAVCNGGTNDKDNLQWLHADVNRMKGSLSQDRFLELCRKVVAWNG